MNIGTLFFYMKPEKGWRQRVAWKLRNVADEIDGFQSIGLKVVGNFAHGEVQSAWDHARREMARALEDLAALRIMDDQVK